MAVWAMDTDGARAEVRYHLGGYAVIERDRIDSKSGQIPVYFQVNMNEIF